MSKIMTDTPSAPVSSDLNEQNLDPEEVCERRGVKVYEARLSETKYAIEIPGLEE